MKSSLFIDDADVYFLFQYHFLFFILLIIKHDLFEVFSIYYLGIACFYDDYVLCPYMRGWFDFEKAMLLNLSYLWYCGFYDLKIVKSGPAGSAYQVSSSLLSSASLMLSSLLSMYLNIR